jgi:hypothetical protein
MKQVRLYSVGEVEAAQKSEASDLSSIDRHALLVYPGKFESMDGPVEITDDHIKKLAENHNEKLSKLKKLSKDGQVAYKNYPPIQLDHSASATMTVGRLIGELSISPLKIDGESVNALFGTVRILGKENVEKVQDGRWTHLSIGADLDDCNLNELTITPFPAASNASLLRGKTRMSVVDSFQFKGNVVNIYKDSSGSFSCVIVDPTGQGYVMQYSYPAIDAIKVEAKSSIEQDKFKNFPKGNQPVSGLKDETPVVVKVENDVGAVEFAKGKKESVKEGEIYGASYKVLKVSPDDPKEQEYFLVEGIKGIDAKFESAIEAQAAAERAIKRDHVYGKPTKLSEGDNMDKEKLKKHLMDKEKLSEKEAEDKLSKMDDEQMSKLAEESDKENKKEELSATREKFAKLSAGFKSTLSKVRLAEKKIKLSARLATLRMQAKITPAEIKKIDIDKLSAKTDGEIDAFLEGYKNRENVIPVGIYGSSKGVSASELAKLAKSKELSQLEREAIASMPFTSSVRLAGKKLSNAEDLPNHAVGGEGGGPTVEGDDSPAHSMLCHMEEAHKSLEAGEHDKAKEHLKGALDLMKAHMGRLNEDMPAHQDEGAEKRMAALSESVKKMESHFDSLVEMVEPVLGIET